ncbi:MAG: ArgE/DapE family deacylase [Candidatus Thorarchaeota archaeon]
MTDITVNEEELLAFLQELIAIESVNPTLAENGTGEATIAQFVASYLQQIALDVQLQEVAPNRANVVSILQGAGEGKSLILNGHLDTVSLSGMEAPLKAEFKDGKVFGRGSLDMKGGVAAMVMALKYLVENEITLQGDVLLTLVADEEYASIGTEAIVKKYAADAAIVCEPTDLAVVIAHKGFAWIKVEVYGKAAHGSLPSRGVDAIMNAGKFLTELDRFEKTDLAKKNHPLVGSATVHASLISGGIELSTYPDYCKIELERRTIPGENRETVSEEIKRIIDEMHAKDPQFNASFEVFFYRPALEVSKEELIVQSVDKARSTILREKSFFQGMSGWLDSAILSSAGIPTVIVGPSGNGAHSAVEFVEFESVVKTTKILIATIMDFCGSKEAVA